MLIRKSQSDFNESSCYLCAKDYTMYSDSCVCSTNDKFISILCNGTNNYGREGSGFITIYDSKPGTFLKFDKVYKCFDAYFIEFVRSSYTVSFCDFVDGSGQTSSYSVVDSIATFENCIFIDVLNKPMWQYGNVKINYINCSSNENRQDMTYTSLEKYDYQTTFSYNRVLCNQIICTKFVNYWFTYFGFFDIFVTLQ